MAAPRWLRGARLEPFPDSAIEDDPETRPDAVYARREATRLAFVAALQRLPARQRAMLIVIELDGDAVSAFHSFRAIDPARYRLDAQLPPRE